MNEQAFPVSDHLESSKCKEKITSSVVYMKTLNLYFSTSLQMNE